MLKFNEIQEAYDYVAFCNPGEAAAYVGKEQGRVVLIPSEMAADDQEIQAAYREIEEGEWLQIPDKYDLGLGKELVFRFAAGRLSGPEQDKVERLFSHRGAYGNWKDFLCERGLLQEWYDFSEQAEVEALKDWLDFNHITYEDENGNVVTPSPKEEE